MTGVPPREINASLCCYNTRICLPSSNRFCGDAAVALQSPSHTAKPDLRHRSSNRKTAYLLPGKILRSASRRSVPGHPQREGQKLPSSGQCSTRGNSKLLVQNPVQIWDREGDARRTRRVRKQACPTASLIQRRESYHTTNTCAINP